MIGKIQRALQVFSRRGPGYGLYLLRGVVVPRLVRRLLAIASPNRWLTLGSAVALIVAFLVGLQWGPGTAAAVVLTTLIVLVAVKPLQGMIRTRGLLARARALPPGEPAPEIPTWESWPVPAETRRRVEEALAQRHGEGKENDHLGLVLVLGRIHQDGLLATDLGSFPGFDTVPESEFRPRDRFDLDLVLTAGRPALRKDFRGDRATFAQEWATLTHLQGHAQVPAVLRVDEARCILFRTLVPGRSLNDLLVAAGARIRETQLKGDEELAHLTRQDRLEVVLARGRELLSSTVPQNFHDDLERQMDLIHRQGVTGLSLTFGNLTVEDEASPPGGRVWLFDFDGARLHRSTASARFALHRDRDRRKYNRIYDRQAMTEDLAQEVLRPLDGDYSPLDLGQGLTTQGFWSMDSGTGRWDFLNGQTLAPLLQGARVLDLGSHTGIMPLLMLRDGARQVVGVEHSPDRAASAHRLREVFAWRYLRPFDLEVHAGDMRMILDRDLGTFDVVTAFCSLYYLDEEDMARMVERAATLAPILVLQAKTDTRSQAADNKAEKSSLEFLEALLRRHGFPNVEIIAPPNFNRPLLIGRTAGSSQKKRGEQEA